VFFYRFSLVHARSIRGKPPNSTIKRVASRHFVAVQNPGYDRLSRRFWNQMMTTGTVKSFNPSKGYGFIKTEGGADVFVHLSAVRTAGFRDLRKGQKISFEIFDNQGKAAARNLHINGPADDDSGHNLSLAEMGPEITRCNMSQKKTEQSAKKRTWIARAALEAALAETVRGSDSRCEGLIEIIVERVVPGSPDGANWAVKGVKYGKAEREPCSAAISKFVEESQSEFEVSDWT
jgi:cold shock CspA family protein